MNRLLIIRDWTSPSEKVYVLQVSLGLAQAIVTSMITANNYTVTVDYQGGSNRVNASQVANVFVAGLQDGVTPCARNVSTSTNATTGSSAYFNTIAQVRHSLLIFKKKGKQKNKKEEKKTPRICRLIDPKWPLVLEPDFEVSICSRLFCSPCKYARTAHTGYITPLNARFDPWHFAILPCDNITILYVTHWRSESSTWVARTVSSTHSYPSLFSENKRYKPFMQYSVIGASIWGSTDLVSILAILAV